MRKELTGPAVPALDLIQNEDDPVFPGQRRQFPQEGIFRDDNAADTLDPLNDDAGDIAFGQFRLHRSGVIHLHEGDLVRRIERRNDCRIVRYGHCTGSPAMEGMAECDDPVFPGMERSQLERILIRLRPGIDQEQRIVRHAAGLSQAVGKFFLERVADAVGIKPDARKLLGQRADIHRMGVPDGDDRMAAIQVQVLISFGIPDRAPASFDRGHIEEAVYIKQIHGISYI